jgi:Ca2+-binding RTX toxin-like protein
MRTFEQLESRCLLALCDGYADGSVQVVSGDLIMVGTSGNDVMQVSLASFFNPDLLRVRLNGSFQNLTVTGDVIMCGRDGNDTLQMSNVPKDARLYGEGGDDYLAAYSGNDLVSGGDGFDRLFGGNGNDVLIAGDGPDILSAGGGDDLLFNGTATADDTDDAAMLALLADWSDNGVLDSFLLSPLDDDDADTLNGDGGNDTAYFGPDDTGNAETIL